MASVPTLCAAGVIGLAALSSVACSSHQSLQVTNESGALLEGMVAGTPISLADGESARLAIHESRTVGLSIPFVEVRARTTGRHVGVRLNGVAYRLPGEYWDQLKQWEDRSWVEQEFDSYGGELSYRSREEVDLVLGEERWRLFEDAKVRGTD